MGSDYRHLSDRVCCLSCRHVYDKPMLGGTVSRNPGCPHCGYVGWLSILSPSAIGPAEPPTLRRHGASAA